MQKRTNNEYKTIATHDTYEAAFYIMYGGKFAKVRSRVLNCSQAKKKGYTHMWTIYVDKVPQWLFDIWHTYNAYGNITKFVDVRNKLKKEIKRELAGSYDPVN